MLQMNAGLSFSFESWWPTWVLADLVDMDDRSLCYCGYACCIIEEGQPSMQSGHWCRRKHDALQAFAKLFPNQLTETGMPTGWIFILLLHK